MEISSRIERKSLLVLRRKTDMSPRISIIMPVWNGEKFIAAAVDSLLAQTFNDFELLVIDDGSTDRTPEILRTYNDPRIRVLRLDHVGIVVALNYGLSQAKAEWIARLDADDLSLPRRLELQWHALNHNSQAVLCHTAVTYFGEDNLTVGNARLPRTRSFMALRLCYQCPIVHSTVLFKKSVALAVGGYLPEERHAEDFSLWGRMLEQGEFIGLPEKLVRFRLHAQSISQKNLAAQQALARQIGTLHCRKFMQLAEIEAVRANALLLITPRDRSWRDWGWFLTRCAPRLRWQSTEVFGWLLWQTIKIIFGGRIISRHAA
jgi:glycosyltransferase involved in cell wall biosynthesis